MRNELKIISENIEQTSRLGYLFGKGKVINGINEQLVKVEENITALEAEKANIETALEKTQIELNQTKDNLTESQENYADLSVQHTQLKSEKDNIDIQFAEQTQILNQTESSLKQAKDDINFLSAEKEKVEKEFVQQTQILNQTESSLKQAKDNITSLSAEKEKVEKEFAEQAENLASVKRKLKRTEEENEELSDELDDVQAQLGKKNKALREAEEKFTHLTEEHQKLEENHTSLIQTFKQEKVNTKLRETLVGALISAKNDNVHLASFRQILNNEFLLFAAEESSLQNEAGALLKLQEIEKELTIIGGLPAFHKARTIAVAGGFSAGKSEFISSFFKNKTLKLPSGIKPTTAIPTYVVNEKKQASKKLGNKISLVGMNQNGAAVDLSEIDPELAKNLKHDFIRSFNFPLKQIMPYMFLSTELKYENICFVDTPGYNPTGSHTSEDMATAKEFVENSEALIWLVGADASGTIPRSDIQFLKNILGKSKKPLYFILNKADTRPESDITKIIQEFSRVLEREHIQYEGISAYNSREGNGLLYWKAKGKKDIFGFLKSMDKPSNKQDDILRKLYEVEHAYQLALKKDIKQRKAIAEALDNVAFDLNEANFKRGNHRIYDQLETISSYFNTQNEEKHLKTLHQLMTNFTNVINQMFGKVSKVERPEIDIDNIDIEEFDFEKKDENLDTNETKSESINRKEDNDIFGLHRNLWWQLFGHYKKEGEQLNELLGK